jgi:hypothetical protein
MSDDLPFGVTVDPPPPALQLGGYDDDQHFDWHRYDRPVVSTGQGAKTFPEPIAVDPPGTKLFPCSGGVDSYRYREATTYRRPPEMSWEEARIALRRLYLPLPRGNGSKPADFVALAEFALAADGYEGFVGKKGDHAGKLRADLDLARGKLRDHLTSRHATAEQHAAQLARPVTQHVADMTETAVARRLVGVFSTMLPAGDRWVELSETSPDGVLAALEDLRSRWATWSARWPGVEDVIARLQIVDRPTAAEYAEALHVAEMLCFVGEKLTSLYAGIMFSMPVYRLYPATPEPEAIGLWWPWGRPAPLIDGPPPRPPKPRKPLLDPSVITATRPQDVVKEVIEKTGINRTTAQRLTAGLRRKMRAERRFQAEGLLGQGLSKVEVARRVGLSPSRVSALFKGKQSSDDERLIDLLRRRR